MSTDHTEGEAVDAEAMLRPKVSAEPVVGNAVAMVAATLLPSAVVGLPASGALLLPCTLLDVLLFLSALGGALPRPLVSVLLLLGLSLPLRLLGALLLLGLSLPLRLLSVLLLLGLSLPLWLLGVLLPLGLSLPLWLLGVLLPLGLSLPLRLLSVLLLRGLSLPLWLLLSVLRLLLLFWLPLRLSMLRLRFGARVRALLRSGMLLLFALLLLPCQGRSSDSEKQRQNGGAGESNRFHGRDLHYCPLVALALSSASFRS
jgi:hypothetical protein